MLSHKKKQYKFLIVEDEDMKFEDIIAILRSKIGQDELEIERAKNVIHAEDCLKNNNYDILLLDISMNISSGKLGSRLGGHANTGGLEILEIMSLFKINLPTIIITGFDYFSTSGKSEYEGLMLDFESLRDKAKSFLEDNLIECIRYSSVNWQEKFLSALERGIYETTDNT